MTTIPPRRSNVGDLHRRMMGNVQAFHSSAFAEAASGQRIGAASLEPFSRRTQVNKSRQSVGGYHEALITHNRASTRSSSISRQVIVPPSRPTNFREPPTRNYNPYG